MNVNVTLSILHAFDIKRRCVFLHRGIAFINVLILTMDRDWIETTQAEIRERLIHCVILVQLNWHTNRAWSSHATRFNCTYYETFLYSRWRRPADPPDPEICMYTWNKKKFFRCIYSDVFVDDFIRRSLYRAWDRSRKQDLRYPRLRSDTRRFLRRNRREWTGREMILGTRASRNDVAL